MTSGPPGKPRARMSRAVLGLAAALLAALLPASARAEAIVTALSTSQVFINSNFTGTDLTVFGAIERDQATISRTEPYRIVVQTFGPRETVVTRRKERRFGIWVNREARIFVDVPSFYSVLTSTPMTDVAPQTLRRYQIGLNSLLLPEKARAGGGADRSSPEFREAFLRLKTQAGLYREYPGRVEFLTESLFRASVPIPANVPIGGYRVQVVLFHGTLPIAEQTLDLHVSKTGFEQYSYDLAINHSLGYGLLTVSLALLTGWLAGVIFRRD
jgi:uncharacterized protein (TIGR02186 family)